MHEMRTFLVIAARHLRRPVRSTLSLGYGGGDLPQPRRSSGTFATFQSLACDALYFRGELPLEDELSEDYVGDSAWAASPPIHYDDLAHVLIPRFFTQDIFVGDRSDNGRFVDAWKHEQDIDGLSKLLGQAAVNHSLAEQVLELKRF